MSLALFFSDAEPARTLLLTLFRIAKLSYASSSPLSGYAARGWECFTAYILTAGIFWAVGAPKTRLKARCFTAIYGLFWGRGCLWPYRSEISRWGRGSQVGDRRIFTHMGALDLMNSWFPKNG